MKKGYNIVLATSFNEVPLGNAATFNDSSFYKNKYTISPTVNVKSVLYNGRNVLDMTGYVANTNSVYKNTPTIVNGNWSDNDVSIGAMINLRANRPRSYIFSFSGSSSFSRTVFLCIENNNTLTFGLYRITPYYYIRAPYKFEIGVDYHINMNKINNIYYFYVNGELIGSTKSDYNIGLNFDNLVSNIGTGSPTIYIGGYSEGSVSLNGKIWDVMFSYGNTVIYDSGFSKYSDNLVYKKIDTSSIVMGTNVYKVDNIVMNRIEIDSFNMSSNFSIKIDISKYNQKAESNDICIINDHRIHYVFTSGTLPDPEVEVNEYTKSALDFENGIIDQVGPTTWTKGGTANITSVNKIFGDTSFETKALGDSLYTTSNIITGGTTPFTIEFYALIKGRDLNPSRDQACYLFSKNNNTSGGDQKLFVSKEGDMTYQYYNGTSWVLAVGNNNKCLLNEINKYTLSYDGSSLRGFLNEKLCFTLGKNQGILTNVSEPYTFLRSYLPSYASNSNTTYGLIDNINIFDGIATKVRDYDEHADKLVVDLAFDGENNSSKIVDNGTLKSNWVVNGNAKISTDQKFDGFSSLYLDVNSSYLTTNLTTTLSKNFTISFRYRTTSNSVGSALFDSRSATGQFNGLLITNPSTDFSSINIYLNGDGSAWGASLNSGSFITANNNYKIYIVCKDNLLCFYVDGVLKTSQQYNFDVGVTLNNQLTTLGRNVNGAGGAKEGYIKNFKIYKGVAVIPESPVGKIQLDFDNNVNDKYSNSTWTNNGVTFDQLNSIKGSSAKFINGSFLASGKNAVFDFKNENFSIEMDLKNTSTSNNIEVIMCSGDTTMSSTTTELQAVAVHCQTYDISNNRSRLLFAYLYNGLDYILGTDIQNNIFYNYNQTRKGNTLIQRVNDVITSTSNYNLTLPINMNLRDNTIIGKCLWRGSSTNSYFNGLIDNLKVSHETSGVVDKPAVHFPFETSVTNIGYLSTIVDSSGTTITPAVMENKKCMKFVEGSTISIPYNGVFDLGLKSDFYFEIDLYINRWTSSDGDTRVYVLSTSDADAFGIRVNETNKFLEMRTGGVNTILNSTVFQLNKFYNIKIYRLNNIIYTSIDNGTVQETLVQQDIRTDSRTIVLGGNSTFSNTKFDGYLANLRLFVGTSTIPNTYHDKKVLDLDFKPTRKSYLFKDNNNKCVIHPVNITQRDYQDSQYCVTLDGINQCLQLGNNELLNFGFDDFVIYVKFKMNDISDAFNMILSGYNNGSSVNKRAYFGVGGSNRGDIYTNKILFDISDDSPDIKIVSDINIVVGTIYSVILSMKDKVLSLTINDVVQNSTAVTNTGVDFNSGNVTIGANGVASMDPSSYSAMTIYSVKVLRNTTDLSLLRNIDDVSNNYSYYLNDELLLSDSITQPHTLKVINDTDNLSVDIDGNVVSVENAGPSTISIDSALNEITVYDTVVPNVTDVLEIDPFTDIQFPDLEYIEYIGIESENFGYSMLSGFYEGSNEIPFKVIHIPSGDIIGVYVDEFNLNYIDISYINEYKIVSEYTEYPVEIGMSRGIITGSYSSNCGITNLDLWVIVRRSDSGRLIGEYQLINNLYSIGNLDKNQKYDIELMDRSGLIKARLLKNRRPI